MKETRHFLGYRMEKNVLPKIRHGRHLKDKSHIILSEKDLLPVSMKSYHE